MIVDPTQICLDARLKKGGSSRRLFALIICFLLSFSISQALLIYPVNAAIRQVPTPTYPTIQSAIDASKRGDTIQVAAGTYLEHLIVTQAELKIIGANKATTIIDGQMTGSPIDLQQATITITGFTITNGGRYPGAKSYEYGGHNITGNIIENNSDGIYFTLSDSNIISGNTFFNNSMRAINLSASIGTQIKDNNISESAYGISLSSANSTTIARNIISETSYGLFSTLSTQNAITNNSLESNACGIQTAYSDHVTISHNTVSLGMYSIQLYKTRDSQLANNTVTGASYGIYLTSSNYNTLGGTRPNLISNNDWGLTLYNSTHNSIIDGNVVAENTWGLYIVSNSDANTIYRNNFFNNVRHAYQEIGSTNTWDNGTAGNYWDNYGGYPPAEGVDYHPLSQPWPFRNIATTSVTASETQVFPGAIVNINVTAKNFGVISENFPVTAYYGSTPIGIKSVTLAPSATQTITFTWNTAQVLAGSYTISGKVGPIPYVERNYSDNTLNDGTIQIELLGDITGPENPPGSGLYPPDGIVDGYDLIYLGKAFGTTDPVADFTGPENPPGSGLYPPDGIVDGYDLIALGKAFGSTA